MLHLLSLILALNTSISNTFVLSEIKVLILLAIQAAFIKEPPKEKAGMLFTL